jgi:hypothetical protein
MLGAVDLLFALGRDDPPQQISPANVDEPILTHYKKPCAFAPLREIILFAL